MRNTLLDTQARISVAYLLKEAEVIDPATFDAYAYTLTKTALSLTPLKQIGSGMLSLIKEPSKSVATNIQNGKFNKSMQNATKKTDKAISEALDKRTALLDRKADIANKLVTTEDKSKRAALRKDLADANGAIYKQIGRDAAGTGATLGAGYLLFN